MNDRISLIEKKLHVKLPLDYAEFISNQGYMTLRGQEIYGYDETFVDINKIPCVIGATFLYRKDYKLPDHIIVISHTGFEDVIVCLDTVDNDVYEIDSSGEIKKVADSFKIWFNDFPIQ